LDVNIRALPNGELSLRYQLAADMKRLRIPPPALPRHVDGLWNHTCFELFLGAIGGPGYLEFNFSPSGEWALYQFKAYRDGGPVESESTKPEIATEQDGESLTLTVTVRVDRVSMMPTGTMLKVGLSAMIEGADGSLSYWALKHPSDKPDFHLANSFALELALPPKSA
jgi:hypothetical protein